MDKDSSDYTLDLQVGYLLRLANQRHSALFQEVVPYGLTPTQFAAMVKLAELGECSQNELGRRTSMDVATIKGVVERLRNKGMVEVNPDPNDKRRTILSIPDTQTDIIPKLHEAGKAITELTLSPLNSEEREQLLLLLKQIG